MATSVLGLKTFAASDPVDVNEVNENYVKIDGGVKTALQGRAAYNIFDNSDWKINQRGITSTEAAGYHADRWKKENSSGKVTVGNGYLSMKGTGAYWYLTQYVPTDKIKSGTVYTIALADTSGSISVCSTVMSTSMSKFTAKHTFTSGAVVNTNIEYSTDKYAVYFTSNSTEETRFAWAALYEGTYTADTLPAYVPKDNELAECQRYYYEVPSSYLFTVYGYCASATNARLTINTPVPMRVNPTVTVDDLSAVRILTASGAIVPTAISFGARESNAIAIFMDATGMTAWTCCTARFSTKVTLSADL